jgi:hypothetical protein
VDEESRHAAWLADRQGHVIGSRPEALRPQPVGTRVRSLPVPAGFITAS